MNDYLSLSEAAKLAPGRPHASSLWRWCRKGVKTRDGGHVRLRHIRAGARVFTTKQWLDEFCLALADADLAHFDMPPSPAVNARRRAAEVERAKARLACAGLIEEVQPCRD